MKLFSSIFDELEHDAKPLLSPAAKWAEETGITIVREIAAELKAALPGELVSLFNATLGKELGFTIPAGTQLTDFAQDLLTTGLARSRAQAVSGGALRVAVLNQGVEQAVLLAKGKAGDTAAAPLHPSTVLATK